MESEAFTSLFFFYGTAMLNEQFGLILDLNIYIYNTFHSLGLKPIPL